METQLIFLGAPGSGKGTQATRLENNKGYHHISTGDLLRSEIKKQSDLGIRVKQIVDSGGLVDDGIVLSLLKLNCDTKRYSYIFDGFPRNLEQAKSLDHQVLQGVDTKVVYFELKTDILIDRLKNRRTCSKCNEIYNLVTSPPKVENTCDKCGSVGLVQRLDDQPEVVKKRMEVFENTINPVLEYYDQKGLLVKVNAAEEVEAVYGEILKGIEDC